MWYVLLAIFSRCVCLIASVCMEACSIVPHSRLPITHAPSSLFSTNSYSNSLLHQLNTSSSHHLHRTDTSRMNPRAPHYKHQSSSSSSISKPRDLDRIYESLSSTFVPASTPTMNSTFVPTSTPAASSTRGTPSFTMSNDTCEPPTHSRSLVKYKPQSSDVSARFIAISSC